MAATSTNELGRRNRRRDCHDGSTATGIGLVSCLTAMRKSPDYPHLLEAHPTPTAVSELLTIDNDPQNSTYLQVVASTQNLSSNPLIERFALSASGRRAAILSAFVRYLHIVDTDPTSPTYMQVLFEGAIPVNGPFPIVTSAVVTSDDQSVLISIQRGGGTASAIARFDLSSMTWIDHNPGMSGIQHIGPNSSPVANLGPAAFDVDVASDDTFAVVCGWGGPGWAGRIEPGSISDSIVGPIDLYPTILAAAGLNKPAGHIVDGESLLPILKQTGKLKRQAYFTWFPHLVPAVSVRQGDWKLIRRFEPHPKYPEVRELYNLKEDIGETRNLASMKPDLVGKLDALIDQFVEDTGALYPKPNPNFNVSGPVTRDSNPIVGLVPRDCEVVKIEGAIRVIGKGRRPFLGTAQVKFNGPLTLKLRARSTAGGTGRVQWRTSSQKTFPKSAQVVTFDLPAGTTWQSVTVQLPIQGKASIIRLYLPAETAAVEVQSIQFLNSSGRKKSWDFAGATP